MAGPTGSTQYVNGQLQSQEGPIYGGSGAVYGDFAAGIAGEVETVTLGTVAASTIQGRFNGSAGFSAVDDFYNGQFVVLQSSPTENGITNVWAQIVDYIGATRTFILDTSVQYPVGASIAVVDPVQLTLKRGFAEPGGIVTVNKSAIINFGGNRLESRVVVSSVGGTPRLVWMKGGDVAGGVRDENTGFCAVLLHDCTIHRAEADFYAFLRTSGSNFGRFEFLNVDVRGLVASRCGFLFASVKGGTYERAADTGAAAAANPGGVFRFVEASGIAITFSNVAIDISGPLSGCVFFTGSAGSIATGAPNYLSLNAVILSSPDISGSGAGPAAFVDDFAIACATGSGAMSITVSVGTINVGIQSARGTPLARYHCSVLKADAATAAFKSVTINSPVDVFFKMDQTTTDFFAIAVTGATGSTANLIVAGTAEKKIVANGGIVSIFLLDGNYDTGTVSVTGSGGWSVFGAGQAGVWAAFTVDPGPNASTVIVSEPLAFTDCAFVFAFGLSFSIAASYVGGTIDLSSAVVVTGAQIIQRHLSSAISGGTWVISGRWDCALAGGGANAGGGVAGPILVLVGADSAILAACSHAGTVASFTCSGAFTAIGGRHLSYRGCHKTTGGSGTATNSGAQSLDFMEFVNAFAFVFSDTAGGTAVGSGAIRCTDVRFSQSGGTLQQNIINLTAGALTGPTGTLFENCIFAFNMATQVVVAGVLTWAAASLEFRHCHLQGVFIIVGTAFSSVLALEAVFAGNVSNLAIDFSGTRPTIYRFFRCDFRLGRPFSTVAAGGRPSIIDDWVVVPNDGAAKVVGELVNINASGEAASLVATGTVEGIVLDAVAAVVGLPVILVRRGIASVLMDAVSAGDGVEQNTLAPFNQADTVVGVPTTGRRVGRSLETVGAGVLAYTIINLM